MSECDTCSGAEPGDPFDLLENLLYRTLGPQTIALAELAHITAAPKAVWVRPADRWSSGHLPSVATDRPTQLVGRQLDRTKLTVRNLSDTPADTVWIGATSSIAGGATHPAYPLRGGREVTLETTGELWAYALAATVGASQLGWTSLELDLP